MLSAVTTTNKIALLVALVVYVGFALTVSMVVPRFRPGFPGARGVRLFVVFSLVLFAGMVASVVAFAHEKPGPPRASTAPASSSATTASTSTTAATTSTSASQASPGNAAHGKQLAASLGCSSCHSLDGSSGVGPTWKGLAGSNVTLTDGSTVSADSAYLLRAIRDPDAQIVKGFKSGVMSSVIRPGSVSVQDAQDLVAFIQQQR